MHMDGAEGRREVTRRPTVETPSLPAGRVHDDTAGVVGKVVWCGGTSKTVD
jgi:hypothetical protein